jgi:hypothetical protein
LTGYLVVLVVVVSVSLVGLPLFAAWVSGTGRWGPWAAAIQAWKGRHPVLLRALVRAWALVVLAWAPAPLLLLWIAISNWRDGNRVLASVNAMQAVTFAVLYPRMWREARRVLERKAA